MPSQLVSEEVEASHNMQVLPGDIFGICRAKISHGMGDIVRFSLAPHGHLGDNAVHHPPCSTSRRTRRLSRRGPGGWLRHETAVTVHYPDGYRIGCDPYSGAFKGCRLSQADQGRFGGRIVRLSEACRQDLSNSPRSSKCLEYKLQS